MMGNSTYTFPVYIGEKEIKVTIEFPEQNVIKATYNGKEFLPDKKESTELKEAIEAEIEELLYGGW